MGAAFDLEEEILSEHSRRQTEKIVDWVGADRKRFGVLVDLFLKGDPLVTQRSAWPVGIIGERHPGLAGPHLRGMIHRMNEPGIHNAVPRNVLRVLQFADIPPGLAGITASSCFAFLNSGEAPIAVKVFAMTVIARIAERKPELGRELRLVIMYQLPYSGAGFCSRAKKILAALDRREKP